MKLSIIIPLYNQEELIVKCLDSIPFKEDIEIIVIDDFSTDNSLKVVEEYCGSSSKKITILANEKNCGVSYSRNRGIEASAASYVMFLDSDDYLITDEFIKFLDKIDESFDMIYYNLEINNGNLIKVNENTRETYCGTTKCIKKDFIEESRFPVGIDMAEDKMFNDELLKRKPKELFTDITACHYNHPRIGSLFWTGTQGETKEDAQLIMWFHDIAKVGGIETWVYAFCKEFCNSYDILVLYDNADMSQLLRLSKYVNIEKYNKSKRYVCDMCILGNNWGDRPASIIANRYIDTVHADYKAVNYKYKDWNLVSDVVCVSDIAKESFDKLNPGKRSSTIENFLPKKENPKKVLHLVSCTRLTYEKGYKRMIILANMLKEAGIKFDWKIFTDNKVAKINMPEIIYMPPSLDLVDYIADADYGVQLSDSEGYCYFVHECLQQEVPVLITDLPSLKSYVSDGNNGYVFDFDMSNVDINKIHNEIPTNFKKDYTGRSSIEKWQNLLGKSIKKTVIKDTLLIQILNGYYDVELGRNVKKGELLKCTKERGSLIVGTKLSNGAAIAKIAE